MTACYWYHLCDSFNEKYQIAHENVSNGWKTKCLEQNVEKKESCKIKLQRTKVKWGTSDRHVKCDFVSLFDIYIANMYKVYIVWQPDVFLLYLLQ